MHAEAYEWVALHGHDRPGHLLDIGGRNVNGTATGLFPGMAVTVLDIAPGPGVDVVADAADWEPDRAYDVVLCTEVFEHAFLWASILFTAHDALTPGGMLVATMAGPGRAPHSAVDGHALRDGEHYENIDPAELTSVLGVIGFDGIIVDTLGPDVRCVAYR